MIGAKTTVCQECNATRNEKKVKKFYRTWEILPDEETCLLEQGLALLRAGHAGRVRGPLPDGQLALHRLLRPQRVGPRPGARMMTAVASMIDSNDPDEIDRIIREGIPDPVGSFIASAWRGATCAGRRKSRIGGATAVDETRQVES